jgi:hypothetical protein
LSDLRLLCETFEADLSRRSLRPQLRALSDRVPRVRDAGDPYRIAMNRLGIDAPTPAEAALKARLIHGGYRSRGLVADALLIAVVETGVGVWVTDDPGPLVLDGDEVVGAGVRFRVFSAPPPATRPLVCAFALVVPGVAELEVREALWVVRELLAA